MSNDPFELAKEPAIDRVATQYLEPASVCKRARRRPGGREAANGFGITVDNVFYVDYQSRDAWTWPRTIERCYQCRPARTVDSDDQEKKLRSMRVETRCNSHHRFPWPAAFDIKDQRSQRSVAGTNADIASRFGQ